MKCKYCIFKILWYFNYASHLNVAFLVSRIIRENQSQHLRCDSFLFQIKVEGKNHYNIE